VIPVNVIEITDSRFLPLKKGVEVITTLEGENPGGSIKDRMVFGELSELIKNGALVPGDSIAEISAGSTALSLAHYCRKFNLKCVLFVPTTIDKTILSSLESLGAEIHKVQVAGAYEKFDEYTLKRKIKRFDQLGNHYLRRHYQSLGEEFRKMHNVTAIVSAIGTGHSLFGAAKAFDKNTQLFSAEPVTPGKVSGIRNLRKESFGEKDPCDPALLTRIELQDDEFFPDNKIETDHGLVQISDSFRVVLGAIEKLSQNQWRGSVFALGSSNLRVR
jgi:cysteine synthase